MNGRIPENDVVLEQRTSCPGNFKVQDLQQSRPISTLSQSQVGLQLPQKEEKTVAQLMQMISMPRLRHAYEPSLEMLVLFSGEITRIWRHDRLEQILGSSQV